MKKIVFLVFYTVALLIIGKNLPFIPSLSLKSEAVKTDELKAKVADLVKKQKGFFSIYYKDLKTGKEFGIDENKLLTGASLNKIFITSYLYNQATNGKINLEDKISIQENDIQDYGTGSLRYQEPGKPYTLKTLSKLALEQSDNTAAHVLGIKLGTDKVQEYVRSLGLKSTNMVNNITSAKDMGRIMELIYIGKVANKSLTLELLDFMKDTDFEDRIARNLPGNVSLYHKTGDAVAMIHDAGIIESGEDVFVLSILTNEIEDEEQVKKSIGKLAKFIYDERKK